jgi:hypothetical protein
MVDIRLERIFAQPLGLDRLRGVKALAKMELLRKGSRLSVQPVSASEFATIWELADQSGAGALKPAAKSAAGKRAAPARAKARVKRP